MLAKYEQSGSVGVRRRNKRNKRRSQARWGQITSNPVHRHRWEMIREGLWKEEEHPL